MGHAYFVFIHFIFVGHLALGQFVCPPQCVCMDIGESNDNSSSGIPRFQRYSIVNRIRKAGHKISYNNSRETLEPGYHMICLGLSELPKKLPTDLVTFQLFGDEDLRRKPKRFRCGLCLRNFPGDGLQSVRRYKGRHWLHFSGAPLTQSSELQHLKINGGRIRLLTPDQFILLKKLKTLDLNNDHMKYVSVSAFRGLNRLENLSISHNKINYLPRYTFSDLVSLRFLDLSHNFLRFVDEDTLKNLNKLEKLDLSKNRIRVLPNYVFPLRNQLLELNLDNNSFRKLRAKWFTGLTKLRKFSVQNNHIQIIYSETYRPFTNLEVLILSNNNIRVLKPNALRHLKNLKVLYLSKNKLNIINDNSFHFNTKLEFLDLENNNIIDLTDHAFTGLGNLKHLCLSNNLIDYIPNTLFSPVYRIKYINVSNNRIRNLRNGTFGNLGELLELDLGSNKLQNLEPGVLNFGRYTKMTWLNLQSNKLISLPNAVFEQCLRLRVLNLADNRIENLQRNAFSSLMGLQHLYLNNNKLKFLRRHQFISQRRLTLLDIAGNRLSTINSRHMSGLMALEDLRLDHNNISLIADDVFSSMTYLQSLKLNNNKLVVFSFQSLNGVMNIHDINLSNNTLYKVDFQNTSTLRINRINLESNNLSVLSERVTTPFVSMGVLGIADNPWKCDCRLAWISKGQHSLGIRLLEPDRTTCDQPERYQGRKLLTMRRREFTCRNNKLVKHSYTDNTTSETIYKCDVTKYLTGHDVKNSFIKKSANILKNLHASVISKIDGSVCNGALLTRSWIVTSGSCLSEQLGLLSGANKNTVRLKIDQHYNAKIKKVKFHPKYRQALRYDFALIKFKAYGNSSQNHPSACIPNEPQLSALVRLLQKSAFTTWLKYQEGKTRLKVRLGELRDHCVIQLNDISGTTCAKLRSSEKLNSTEMSVSGAPFYLGFGQTWSLVGLAGYTPQLYGTDVRLIPLWNSLDFIIETLNKYST